MVPMAIARFEGMTIETMTIETMTIEVITMLVVPVMYCSAMEWILKLGFKDERFAENA
jgi:Cu(I)/Ag(I) efflux system membrane protein CusA/SilA